MAETLDFSVPSVPSTVTTRVAPVSSPTLVIVNVLVCAGVIEAGLKEHEADVKVLVQRKVMLFVYVSGAVTPIVNVVEVAPLSTVVAVGLMVSVYSGRPPPANSKECGLPVASSVMVTAPLAAPVAVTGVKVTVIVQKDLGAIAVVGQSLV